MAFPKSDGFRPHPTSIYSCAYDDVMVSELSRTHTVSRVLDFRGRRRLKGFEKHQLGHQKPATHSGSDLSQLRHPHE